MGSVRLRLHFDRFSPEKYRRSVRAGGLLAPQLRSASPRCARLRRLPIVGPRASRRLAGALLASPRRRGPSRASDGASPLAVGEATPPVHGSTGHAEHAFREGPMVAAPHERSWPEHLYGRIGIQDQGPSVSSTGDLPSSPPVVGSSRVREVFPASASTETPTAYPSARSLSRRHPLPPTPRNVLSSWRHSIGQWKRNLGLPEATR